MRITRPGPPVAGAARREPGRAGAAAGGFSLGAPRGAEPAVVGGAGPTFAGSALHALMSLQVLPDAAERRRSARRGAALLDHLDELRLALLDGEVPVQALADLRGELAAARAASGDPHLDDLLREIEVRAAVELAKLEPGGAGL
jgi:Class II flagellar assembly regulator